MSSSNDRGGLAARPAAVSTRRLHGVLVAMVSSLVLLAGCAVSGGSNGVQALREPPASVHTKRSKPYNKPAEAQQFFAEVRMPEGTGALDASYYERAREQAGRLGWYSSATNELQSRDSRGLAAELSTWQQLGPGNIGGRTRVIRFEPGNANVMYIAGVAGGVWKSTNGGAGWTPLTDLAPNLAVVSMAIDRTDVSRLWVGTGEGVFNADAVRGAGIFVSVNGGADFERLSSTNTTDFHFVNDLVQSPTDAATLYAATRTGLWLTRNLGATWTRVIDTTTGPVTHFGGCFDIDARANAGPVDDVVVSCGTFLIGATDRGFVYRNPDALNVASLWTPVLQPTGMARTTLARAPSDPNVIYALAAGTTASATTNDGLLGIWRSADSGATWVNRLTHSGTNANNNLLLSNPVIARLASCGFGGGDSFLNQGWYDNIIAVDPVNPDRIWTGGVDLFRSDDGGQTFGVASYWWFFPDDANYAHADQHALVFHPDYNGTTNQMLFVGNDGGIQRTSNAAAAVGTSAAPDATNSICGNTNLPAVTWESLNNDYAITQFYYGTVYPNNTRYVGGTQDNGTLRGAAGTGTTWEEINGGDGSYTAVNPVNTAQIFAATTGISIVRSDDDGVSFFSRVAGISDSGMFINPFTMDPNAPTRLWTSGRRMWRTDNSANNWVAASATGMLPTTPPFTTAHRFSTHAIAPGLPDLVLAGTNQGQIRRTIGATTATGTTVWDVTGTPPRLRPGFVGDIAFNEAESALPANSRTAIAVYATFNGATNPNDPHVFRSTDGGQTWTGLDGTGSSRIPNVPVHTVVIDPTSGNQRIFVGTDIGVFVTTDGGATWMRENGGAANTVVEELVLQRNPISGRLELIAFTHGRSAYKTEVAELDPQPSTDPGGIGSATPPSAAAGAAVSLSVAVTPGTNPASTGITVTADLSSIGGGGNVALPAVGGNVFTLNTTVAGNTLPGVKTLPATVRDLQGRSAVANIALTVLAPTSPSGVGAAAPSTAARGANVLLTVQATAGTNPASTGLAVRGDLSTIGGSSTTTFLDDGMNGDASAGDGIFSFTASIGAATAPGAKSLPFTVSDAQSRSGGGNIALTVSAPTSPSGTGAAAPATVAVTGSTLLTVQVSGGTNPGSTGLAVEVDLTGIGGDDDATMYDDGTHGDANPGDGTFSLQATVALGTAAGAKSLDASISDAEGRSGAAAIGLTVEPLGSLMAAGVATPSGVRQGQTTLLEVTVTPALSPNSSGINVTVDLSAYGGSAAQVMYDDGSNGDATAGNNVYTAQFAVPGNATPGAATVSATVNDAQSRNVTADIGFTVTPASDDVFEDGFESP